MARITLLFKRLISLRSLPVQRSFLYLLVSASTLHVSCSENKRYEPANLRKLDGQELVVMTRNKQFPDVDNLIVKDSAGNTLTKEEFLALDFNQFGADQYADSSGLVTEIVIRRITEEDLLLREIVSSHFNSPPPVEIIDIDCSQVSQILNEVYNRDQKNRQNSTVSDLESDLKNQQLVVSIIEHCGFPTLEAHGYTSVQATFLVIQHADKNLRKKYFPEFKRIADKGDFSQSTLALMEDRILMDEGQKQIYGTQVHKLNGESEWKLYPLTDPACVNERRAKVGLGPIEDYLKNFGIDYHESGI